MPSRWAGPMFNNISPNFMRNPLGIIALFIVMIYAMAGLVTTSEALSPDERRILVIFLVAFPLIVLAVFYLLVTRHSEKLYAPGDFKDEDNYLRAQGKARNESVQFSGGSHPGRSLNRRLARWIDQSQENHRSAADWLRRQGISSSLTTFVLINPDEILMRMIDDLNIPEDRE